MIKKMLMTCVMVLLMQGCTKSILDNEARCPFIDRGGCQSMEMVNKMVDERRFTPDGLFVQQACIRCKPKGSRQSSQQTNQVEVYK